MYWFRFLTLFKIAGVGGSVLGYYFHQSLFFSNTVLLVSSISPFWNSNYTVVRPPQYLLIYISEFPSYFLCVASFAMCSYLPFILKHLLLKVDTEILISVIKFLFRRSICFPDPVHRLVFTYTFKISLDTFKILVLICYFSWLYAAFTDLGL